MASNFDFLKTIDKELYEIILDSEKLFRDEYFNQCAIQLRIFAEKMAKKILNHQNPNLTFDDTLNCLKDKIKTEKEKEFIDDLFFIKKIGNKSAHGEDSKPSDVIEAIERAFEAAINYAYSKKKDEKINKLQFDTTLLVTQKPLKDNKLIDKYVQLAQEQKEELLNSKQGEFNSQVEKKDENGFKDKNFIKNTKKYKKKELTPAQKKIKEKVKQAKKNLKENINKPQKAKSKPKKNNKKKKSSLKHVLFCIFVIISLILILKMLLIF